MNKLIYIVIFFMFSQNFSAKAQDTLIFKGQLSSYLLWNSETELAVWSASRYIPQLNYTKNLKNTHQLDFEISANLLGSLASDFSDTLFAKAEIKAYRLWARYSGKQFEFRVGLQKLNFGSAMMLRPLMWFDGMDSRDPLSLTEGVYGVLGRYYFLNNANVWLWGLYGNEKARGWDFIPRKGKTPELGGRIQLPVGENLEMAFTYHYNTLNSSDLSEILPSFETIPEHKFAYDIKADFFVGLWLETSWSMRNAELGIFKNQELITLGLDYTFGIGNGFYTAVEHLVGASDEKAFTFVEPINFTALSTSYPIGLFDNLGLMFYYDWTSNSFYNFANWQKQLNKLSFHIMAFWNPENSALPTQQSDINLFGGKGIQLMLVYNY